MFRRVADQRRTREPAGNPSHRLGLARRAAVLAIIVGAGAAFSPASGSNATTRSLLSAGALIKVVGTELACQVSNQADSVFCFRFGKTGLVPRSFAIKVKSEGTVLVLQRAGTNWDVAYARAQTTSIARTSRRVERDSGRVHLVTLNDFFRVRGTRIACQVAHEARRLAVQCGLVDSGGRLPASSTVGAVLRQDGFAAAVAFDAARMPRVLYRSTASGAQGMLKLAIDASVLVKLSAGLSHMACGAVVFQGNKLLTCYRANTTGEISGYGFAIVQDGAVLVTETIDGVAKPVYHAPGRGLRSSKKTELPTTGDTFNLAVGQYFKLTGTQIVCSLERPATRLAITCGVADSDGIGAPRTNAVRLEENGVVTVVRIDAKRKPRVVFRGSSTGGR